MQPSKFDSMQNGGFAPHIYPNLWKVEQTTGPQRLVVAPSDNYVDLIVNLTRALPEPFWILYVLTTPRATGKAGRYQSAGTLEHDQLEEFLCEFKNYFECDGRHDLWIYSVTSQTQIVYDNHNLIYIYGALDEAIDVLEEKGLSEGAVHIPAPHGHNYHAEFDPDEKRILNYGEWIHFPLEADDD